MLFRGSRHFEFSWDIQPRDKMSNFANVRQVMLKQRRGAKCPFLTRFVSLGVDKGERDSFVSTNEAFEAYCAAVAIWTEGDSVYGQTKDLIKRKAFDKASPCPFEVIRGSLETHCTHLAHNVYEPLKVKHLRHRKVISRGFIWDLKKA